MSRLCGRDGFKTKMAERPVSEKMEMAIPHQVFTCVSHTQRPLLGFQFHFQMSVK